MPCAGVSGAGHRSAAVRRLAARDAGRWDEKALDAFCGWAAWHRGHARDPRHRPDVLVEDSWSEMAWQRWTGWTSADPRWHTHVIDTSGRALSATVDEVALWATVQRASHRSGRLPLSGNWWDQEPDASAS